MEQDNNSINEYLKKLRTSSPLILSQKQLAKKLGISSSLLSQVETGSVSVTDKTLKKYSDFFSIPLKNLKSIRDTGSLPSENIDDSNIVDLNQFISEKLKFVNVPYFESISAGIEADLVDESPVTYVPIFLPKNIFSSKKNIVAIKINGDSMNLVIPNHSIALIDKDVESIKSGDIVAYQLDGNNYGLKRFFETTNEIFLVPESTDDSFKKRILNKQELNSSDSIRFNIIGKLIGFYKLNYNGL